MRFFIKILVLAACCLAGVEVFAGQGNLQFVEAKMILYPDGKCSLEYIVRYRVISGEFHGFYF